MFKFLFKIFKKGKKESKIKVRELNPEDFGNKVSVEKKETTEIPEKNIKPEKTDIVGKEKVKSKTDDNWSLENFNIPNKEGEVRFHDFDLDNSIMRAIQEIGFEYCTPIQAKTLPETLQGKDVTAKAQTGTGKTAAFLITILQLIIKNEKYAKKTGEPVALILAPTRELVLQIAKDAENLSKYTNINVQAVFGGMDYNKQLKLLNKVKADIIVATPGRLLDYINKKAISLSKIDFFVVDEADRMMDMGFIPDMNKIVRQLPGEGRQTMFFSATLSDEILRLADNWTFDPVMIEVETENVTASTIKQFAYVVSEDEKLAVLVNLLKKHKKDKSMIFCNRKDTASNLMQSLKSYGISCAVITGDLPQKKRIRVLDNFKNKRINVLIATDVAARGIHIDDVAAVFNYQLPEHAENYVHRIGRTGRAGLSGISYCFATEEDGLQIPLIEEFIGEKIESVFPEDELLEIKENNSEK